ncbi:MAG TPA: hypothetical protein DER04_02355 [Holosporales bacterium]|nr:hypothetical protein [Holosporales bacterium]HBW24674.1 hypothetical protein [Holosporales bacterium]HCC25370.1 hypothetical protein [Holosporales bacterium]HCE95594.1 hypothetical protein [Holosporales bacterium]
MVAFIAGSVRARGSQKKFVALTILKSLFSKIYFSKRKNNRLVDENLGRAFMTGQEIRYQVRSTKGLFMDLFLYFFGNSLFILMWYVFDRNEPFWPKYILLVWGVALGIETLRKQVLPCLSRHILFFNRDWEERKVKELTSHEREQHKIFLNRYLKKHFKNIQV